MRSILGSEVMGSMRRRRYKEEEEGGAHKSQTLIAKKERVNLSFNIFSLTLKQYSLFHRINLTIVLIWGYSKVLRG